MPIRASFLYFSILKDIYMKQYDIITHHSIVGLASNVNSKIKIGWKAHGSMVASYDPNKNMFVFAQPIIKE